MTEEIIIDVSGCPHKSDDDCMEVPICNEYGDLMGYQSCEAQTLCPYRSQKKIERLEQERDELKFENDRYKQLLKGCPTEDEDCGLCVIDEQNKRLKQENKELKKQIESDKGLITIGGKQQYEYLQKIDELEQENKELKTCIEMIQNTEGQAHIEGVRLAKENEKLKSALEEIREVIYYCGYKDVVDKVLPKINEALNLS